MKTYLKTFARMFKRHATRLISVFLMVLLSIGFSAGIGMATDKMRYALDEVYRKQNVSDFIVRGEGDLSEYADALREKGYEVTKGGIMEFEGDSLDLEGNTVRFVGTGEGITRVYFFAEGERDGQNVLETLDATPMPEDAPDGSIPIAVERATAQLKEYALGDRLKATLFVSGIDVEFNFVITEIVQNPLHLAVRNDPSMMQEEGGDEDDYKELESIFYLPKLEFSFVISIMGREMTITQAFPANNLYISVPKLKQHSAIDITSMLFDAEYERNLKAAKAEIEAVFAVELAKEDATLGILTLHENFTFESYLSYLDKVEIIGYVLMIVFVAVTLLVVLSTMTRLLDEERSQIACLSTLGYSPARIISKYLLFALVGTAIGSAGGYFAAMGLAYVIYVNFHWNYTMPAFPSHISLSFFMIVTSIIVVATLAATLIAGLKKTQEHPANLLRPKSPKPGKKVILERIPLLWKRIPFKLKSTFRNVLRFKVRFCMTVVAVMASTALVLAGLAVLDMCIFQEIGTFAMIAVAIVILVFAALLNAVVIYTLTNINISERERELATLMVLGYHDKEVSLYIYREIYITSTIGILLGLPFGAILCTFIFSLMSMGTLAGVNFYVWLVAPVMSLLFTFLVTLLLRRKIVKIDMNASLKAIE